METKEWLTAKELAKAVGVSVQRVYNWKRERKIPKGKLKVVVKGFRKRILFHSSLVEQLKEREVCHG
jgi:predicted site-specific integrase-resolvase